MSHPAVDAVVEPETSLDLPRFAGGTGTEPTADQQLSTDRYHVGGTTQTVITGEALDALALMADNSVDAVVTDPPYGLSDFPPAAVTDAMTRWAQGDRGFIPTGRGFMDASWDSFVPPPALWDEVFRVLKPGGHALVFAGARTQDLMGLSCRLAGFEIRDVMMWGYGTGMPKGQNISKMAAKKGLDEIAETYAGWNTQLKPAYEPILMLRKPMTTTGPTGRPKKATVLDSIAVHGTGAINIDGTRVAHRNAADLAESSEKNRHGDFGTMHGGNTIYGDYTAGGVRDDYDGTRGRFPSNVMFSHADDCIEYDDGQLDCVPGCPVGELDAQSGITRSVKGKEDRAGKRYDSDTFGGGNSGFSSNVGPEYDDIGGASRFFWCGKAKTAERPVIEIAETDPMTGEATTRVVRHVSVKPLDLIQRLIRLVTPPNGVVLDVFAGSGTSTEAAILEGFDSVAIEREPDHVLLIEERISRQG